MNTYFISCLRVYLPLVIVYGQLIILISLLAFKLQWNPGNTTNHGTDVGVNMGVNFMITYSHQKNCVVP
jgi:hypothetical protein